MKYNCQCCKNKLAHNDFKQLTDFLKIISDESRLRILCTLHSNRRCVCEIWQNLDLPQNLISHHLRILKAHNLLAARKKGTYVFYKINQKEINKYLGLLKKFFA